MSTQKFDIHTPLVADGPGVGVARSHIKYFQQNDIRVNAAPQIVKNVPINSAAPGVAGQEVISGTVLYKHNGTQWVKFTGVTF